MEFFILVKKTGAHLDPFTSDRSPLERGLHKGQGMAYRIIFPSTNGVISHGYLEEVFPTVRGWVTSTSEILNVTLYNQDCDTNVILEYGLERPDVEKALQSNKEKYYSLLHSGLSGQINFTKSQFNMNVKLRLKDGTMVCSSPIPIFITSNLSDNKFLREDVPLSKNIKHNKWAEYLGSLFNKKGHTILEIGSRRVTKARPNLYFNKATYIGFDFYPGENVDIVGDAHELSNYFNIKFDLIFSHAVFEHFAMPWIVSQQIIKLLKVGGYTFHETHFSFSSHERPWHFFQFSELALQILFPEAAGIRCVEAGMCNPMVGRFSTFADDSLRWKAIPGLYCHSDFLGIKERDVPNFSYKALGLKDVISTVYPKPQELSTNEKEK